MRLAELAAVRGAGRRRRSARDPPRRASSSPFPVTPVGAEDPLLAPILAGELDPADDTVLDLDGPFASRRPLLVGGAITSAAISLVGVAWVAWRATRPAGRDGGPATGAMSRAARAAHGRRVPPALSGRFGGLS